VARALVGSSVAVLVMGLILNSQGQTAGGPKALSWVAVGWALLAPVVAVAVRGRGLVEPGDVMRTPEEQAAWARRSLLFFAVLESAAVLAGIAAIVSRPWWPLAAAAVPLAVMVLNLPPRRG
jgi:hypothetical protein